MEKIKKEYGGVCSSAPYWMKEYCDCTALNSSDRKGWRLREILIAT